MLKHDAIDESHEVEPGAVRCRPCALCQIAYCVILLLLAFASAGVAQDGMEPPVVEMGASGPLQDFVDFDALLRDGPPTPQASAANDALRVGLLGGFGTELGDRIRQMPGLQWVHQQLHPQAAPLDGGVIDELLIVDEGVAAWPAPAGVPLGADFDGGLLGVRGAMRVATQGGTHVLPNGLIYRPYLAGPKESRLSTRIHHEADDQWLFDNTLGAHVGLIRWGAADSFFPQGVQIDLEASAQLRLDLDDELDLRSADYRAGVPITFGFGNQTTKLAYYHLSSHLGDEFLVKTNATRLNYARDVIVLGHAIYMSPALRFYGEAGWAFYHAESDPWEFQFGVDYAPARATGPGGSPFFGVNGILREELNYSGTLTAHLGWAWRSHQSGRLLRMGLHYVNGASTQYSFLGVEEQQLGFGIWLD